MEKVKTFLTTKRFLWIISILLLTGSIIGVINGYFHYKEYSPGQYSLEQIESFLTSFLQLENSFSSTLLLLEMNFLLVIIATLYVLDIKNLSRKANTILFVMILLSPFVITGLSLLSQISSILSAGLLIVSVTVANLYFYAKYEGEVKGIVSQIKNRKKAAQ